MTPPQGSQEHDATFYRIKDYLHTEVVPKIESIHTEVVLIKNDTEDLCKDGEHRQAQIDELVRTLKGTNGQPGLIAKVDELIKWKDARVWLERLLIAALVSQAIVLLFQFIEIAKASR
jgi:hypothetical protein